MQTIESMFINDCVLIDTWWNVNCGLAGDLDAYGVF